MSKFLLTFLTCFLCFLPFNSFGQCTNYEEVFSEGFEYPGTNPGFITGTTYQSTPQSYCPHSGNKSLYLNFWNGHTGLAYDWSITTCENATYKFSFWAKDCFSSVNNITVSAEDDNGIVLTSSTIITTNQWSQYTLGPFTTSTSPIHFKISTNIAGGPGNDLSIDDLVLEICTPDVNINGNPIEALNEGICTNTPISLSLPTSGINYSNPEFQWQLSTDNGISWTDIPGTDSSSIELIGFFDGYQIRTIIAETGNINDVDCRYITDPVTLTVYPLPVINPPSDFNQCGNIDSIGYAAFDLYTRNDEMSTDLSYDFHYYSSLSDAEADTLELIQLGYINTTNPETVYIRIVIDSTGCQILDSMVLIAWEQPIVDLGPDTSLCEDQQIILDATYANPNATYLWHDGSTEPTFTVLEDGLQSVTVTLDLCTATDDIMVTLYQLPDFEFGPNIDKCINDTVYLSSGIEGALSYTWNTGSTDKKLLVTEFGEYELEVETECGTFKDRIEVEPIFCGCPIEFPNAISPNGDGVNDYFELIDYSQVLPECEFDIYDLMIYDRWGRELFRSTDPSEKWAGPLDADPHQSLYVYYLKYTFLYSPVFEKNGTIIILQ